MNHLEKFTATVSMLPPPPSEADLDEVLSRKLVEELLLQPKLRT